jgi:hypothetical protein
VERFLGVKGRKCRPYECNYHSSKGEMLALVYAISKFEHLLRLRKFIVITDSNTVLHWSTMKDSGGTVRRWLDHIQQFNFTVKHRAGKYNTNADLISRAKHMDEPSPSCVDSITQGKEEIYPIPWSKVNISSEYIPPSCTGKSKVNISSEYIPPSCTGKICTIVELPWHLATANGIEGRGPPLIGTIQGKIGIDQNDLEKAQIDDGALNLVRSWFNEKTGKIDDKKIDTEEFEGLHNDVVQLYKVRKQLRLTKKSSTNQAELIYLLEDEFEAEPRHRIVIPPSHRYQALLAVHAHEHWGVQRTMQQVRLVFYWPGWRKDTSIFVTECAGCLHREEINLKNVEPFENLAKNVNDVLCMDLVGPLTLSPEKNKYILTLMCQFSRFVSAVAIPDKSAKTVSTAIMKNWIGLYGAPTSIRTDSGCEFKNSVIVTMMKALNVKVKVGTPYSHNSNPIERFHRTLWALLKGKRANGECNWEKSLPTLILAYNATQHYSTLCSPARVFLGRETNLPHLSLIPKFKDEAKAELGTLEEELDMIIDLMRQNDTVRIRRQFKAYSTPREDINVGDLCYAAVLPAIGDSRKLLLNWSGPVEVTEIINSAMLRVKEIHVNRPREYVAHRSKLRLCKKMGEKDLNPIFRLPRLPKEIMLQLADELSLVELPCLVENQLVDEFYEDLGDHKEQKHDDDSSDNSDNRETVQEKSGEDQQEESEDNDEMFQSFNNTINQSIISEINSPNLSFTTERTEQNATANIVLETSVEEQLTSAASTASQESEQEIEAEPEKEKEHVQDKSNKLESTETIPRAPSSGRSSGRSSGSGGRRSTRISKPVKKFDPSPSPRTPIRKSRTSLPSAVKSTGSKISGKMSSIARAAASVK